MKKDDALALRERLAAAGSQAAAKAGFDGLADDGKLSHDEVADVARWALRMSLPGRWPHRYEPMTPQAMRLPPPPSFSGLSE